MLLLHQAHKKVPELHIYVQDPVRKTWNPAGVIDQEETPRSYLIELELNWCSTTKK